jgi:phage shock protein A
VQERLTREDAALAQRAHELREQLAELAAQRAALQADTAAADEHINKIRAERDALKVRAYDVRAAMDGEDA